MRPRTMENENPRLESPLSVLRSVKTFLLCLIALAGLAAAQAQTVPTATASSSQMLIPSFANPVVGHLATNSFGDLFYVNASYSGSATLYQLPRGTTTPVTIATGFSGARNVYVDSNNNVFVPNAYGGNIIEFPYVNGAYVTNFAVTSSIAFCNNYTPTAPCAQFGATSSVVGSYYQPVDMGFDSAGNAYVLDIYSNGSCTNNCIVKLTNSGSGGAYATTVIYSGLPANSGAQLATDAAGDVFYADSSNALLEVFSAGTTSPVAFGTGITSPAGVSFDPYGNLYVSDSASPYAIFEFPGKGGTVLTGTQFAFVSTYSNDSVAVDTEGDMYYTGYSGGVNLNVAHVNGIPVGSSPLGTPVSATPTSITFTFAAQTTVTGITSTGPSFAYTPGSCSPGGTYSAASSCTVNVTYTPTAVGLQRGSINLTTTTGASISSALLSGIGLGAAEVNDPGTVTSIGSNFVSPTGIAVDEAGNVYVADPGQNAVLRYAGGTGTPTTVGTGLSKPTAVRLDNAGNLYIADGGNGRIVEVPNYNGTLTNSGQTVVISGLGTNLGLAFDYLGNLYITDRGKTYVTELPSVGGQPMSSAAFTIAKGFTMPSAVATDFNGNVFIADYGTTALTEIAFLGRGTSSVGGGLTKPTGIATDASGSLYIADAGSRVLKLPLEGTSYNTNDQYTVNSTVLLPYSVALSGSGNLYIVDNVDATANLVNRVAGTLPLGRAQIMTTTSAQNANIGNAGNQTLTFGAIPYTQTSAAPTYFTVTSPSGTGCAASGTVLAGRSCVLSATFTPTNTGGYSDLLTFSSNAVNGTPSTLNLTGTGLNLAADTLTLSQTTATANFGSPVTIQATVTSSVAGTPSGTVTFSVDGNNQSPAATVTNGIASITLNGLTGGSHTVCGSYTGDNTYRPQSNCLVVVVSKVTTTTTLTIVGASTTPLSSTLGASSTLTATVVASTSTPPTGMVTFTAGSTTIGTAPLTAAKGGGYTAVLTTTNLPVGSITVTATYSGDVNYNTSSGSLADIVTYATFIVTPQTNSITMPTIGVATLNITVTALGGFNGTVGLQCQGLPANTICTFSPNGLLLQNNIPQLVTMQVLTGQTPVQPQPVIASMGLPGRLALLAFFTLIPLWYMRRRYRVGTPLGRLMMLLVLVLGGVMSAAMTGCGGSGLVGVTPKGTFNVVINGVGTNSATTYTGGNAPGCTVNAGTSTCTETAALTLAVQ